MQVLLAFVSMSERRSTGQRLINAAIRLFASQGITDTTTRQIAELAEVNEVTLFRQFGNKQGLLLAVIEDSAVFTRLGGALGKQASQMQDAQQALRNYALASIQELERIPELVRSLIGESGQYPLENRRALGRSLTEGNRYVTQYLATVTQHQPFHRSLSVEALAMLLNSLLLGYVVIELTSEFHELWRDREDFLANLMTLFLEEDLGRSASESHEPVAQPEAAMVADLPNTSVHQILQQAKQQGLQEYALVYVLFGAGLSVSEVVSLERSHSLSTPDQHLLQMSHRPTREVPLNQWIWGKRYGSYTNNPLTRWLKSRKDQHSALFLNSAGQALSQVEVRLLWQSIAAGLTLSEPPQIEQASQTWRVEMLMKGISIEDLSLLTGQSLSQLEPYAQRAKAKLALEQAIQKDQKS